MTPSVVMTMAAMFLCGVALGWFLGWARGFNVGTRDERVRWSSWIVPPRRKDRP